MTRNDLLIVVINWRHEEETLTCLEGLRPERGEKAGGRRAVILIDSECQPERAEWHKPHSALYDYYDGRAENIGFAGACNLALATATRESFDKILFLNADAELAADTIDLLCAALDRNANTALVSPMLCDEETREPYFCGFVPKLERSVIEHLDENALHAHLAAATDGRHGLILHGTVLMASVETLASLGGFDERFFAYWEDTDLSMRCLEKGYDCRLVREAKAYHQSGRGDETGTRRSGYFFYYMARNEVRFWYRHGRGLARIRALRWHLARSRAKIRELRQAGHVREANSLRLGLIHGFLSVGGRWRGQPA